MHERDNEYPNIKYSVAYIVQLTEHEDFFLKVLLGISRLSAQVTFPIEHVPASIFCKKGTSRASFFRSLQQSAISVINRGFAAHH